MVDRSANMSWVCQHVNKRYKSSALMECKAQSEGERVRFVIMPGRTGLGLRHVKRLQSKKRNTGN
jgi:hypothetical protein